MFELGDDGDSCEGCLAVGLGAEKAGGRAHGYRGVEAFEDGRSVAGAAVQGEAGGVFEADGVWDLGFEGEDFGILSVATASVDLVFSGVEAETFGQADGIGAWDGCA